MRDIDKALTLFQGISSRDAALATKFMDPELYVDRIRLLLGQGDFVFLVAEGTHQGEPCAFVDLYRVENDRIVEHWGFPEHVPPPDVRKNANGVF